MINDNRSIFEWITITKETKFPTDIELLFDGNEHPPIWGTVKYNGFHPCISYYESSGEEKFEDIWKYERYLSEIKYNTKNSIGHSCLSKDDGICNLPKGSCLQCI